MERLWTPAVQSPATWGHAREMQPLWLRAFSFILSILHLNSYLWLVATLLISTGIEYRYPQYFYRKKKLYYQLFNYWNCVPCFLLQNSTLQVRTVGFYSFLSYTDTKRNISPTESGKLQWQISQLTSFFLFQEIKASTRITCWTTSSSSSWKLRNSCLECRPVNRMSVLRDLALHRRALWPSRVSDRIRGRNGWNLLSLPGNRCVCRGLKVCNSPVIL